LYPVLKVVGMILCIDPEADELAATREALEAGGFRTFGAASVADGWAKLEASDSVACLVTECGLDDGTGLELIREAREIAPDVACVLYTDAGLGEIDTAGFGDVIAEYVPEEDPAATDRLVDVVEHSLAFRSQTAYPLPDDEDTRLAALERYAHDPEAPSASLDRLTELATARLASTRPPSASSTATRNGSSPVTAPPSSRWTARRPSAPTPFSRRTSRSSRTRRWTPGSATTRRSPERTSGSTPARRFGPRTGRPSGPSVSMTTNLGRSRTGTGNC
jgi:DNA-binding NarL/FixJ family response regulator